MNIVKALVMEIIFSIIVGILFEMTNSGALIYFLGALSVTLADMYLDYKESK